MGKQIGMTAALATHTHAYFELDPLTNVLV